MKKALTILAAAGMTVAMIGGTSAADIPMVPTVAAPAPPPAAPPPPAFSFAGPYFGAHGGISFNWCGEGRFFNCEGDNRWHNFGLQGGYNVLLGPALLGIEVRTGLIFGCDGWCWGYSDLNLHLGAVIGERLAIYGIAGLGIVWGVNVEYMNLGLGVEYLVTPDIGVFAQVLRASEPFDIGDPIALQFQVGLNLH